jgi:CRP/FNR family transcriptional regulator, cyclic AMP receptor protein
MTALEALQRAPLFKDFTETGLKIFAAIAQEKAIPAGTPIFVENMVGESLFIVKSGTVRLTQKTAEGERELGILGAGEHLGELALLAKSVRLVSAVAATQCEVLELSQRDFARLQPQKPQACLKLALAIAADVAARVAETRDLLRELGAKKPGA